MDRLSSKPLPRMGLGRLGRFNTVFYNFSLTPIADKQIIETPYGYPRVTKITEAIEGACGP